MKIDHRDIDGDYRRRLANLTQKAKENWPALRRRGFEYVGHAPAYMAFFACIIVFFYRIYKSYVTGFMPWTRGVAIVLGCLALVYASFVIEGIVLASAKIEDYDTDVVTKKFSKKEVSEGNLLSSLLYVKGNSDAILIGQPLAAIVITLLFDKLFSTAQIPAGSAYLAGEAPVTIFILSNEWLRIAVSSLVIYWFAQLLPQDIGKNASIEFMKVFAANTVARCLVLISRSGVGTPKESLKALLYGLGFPKDGTRLPVGLEKAFTYIASEEERFAEVRTITFRQSDGVAVISDSAIYKYQERFPEYTKILQAYRVRAEQLLEGINYAEPKLLPPDFPHQTFTADNYLVSTSKRASLESNDYVEVLRETIIVLESSSIAPPESLETSASYKTHPLVSGQITKWCFTIGELTKRLVIEIFDVEGMMIHQPTIDLVDEQDRMLDDAPIYHIAEMNPFRRDKNKWVVNLDFLRSNSEVIVEVDPRPARPS